VLGIEPEELYVSVLVLGEIEKGIELVAPRDVEKARAAGLARATAGGVSRTHGSRRSRHCPRMGPDVGDAVPVIDGLLAATAKVRDLTLVTRNTKQLAGLGARLLDPFR
jgi:predicted nucleic acid-binding protein